MAPRCQHLVVVGEGGAAGEGEAHPRPSGSPPLTNKKFIQGAFGGGGGGGSMSSLVTPWVMVSKGERQGGTRGLRHVVARVTLPPPPGLPSRGGCLLVHGLLLHTPGWKGASRRRGRGGKILGPGCRGGASVAPFPWAPTNPPGVAWRGGGPPSWQPASHPPSPCCSCCCQQASRHPPCNHPPHHKNGGTGWARGLGAHRRLFRSRSPGLTGC